MKWIFSLLFWLYGAQADPQPESVQSPNNPFGVQVENIRNLPVNNQQRGFKNPRRIGTHIIIFEDTHFREKNDL